MEFLILWKRNSCSVISKSSAFHQDTKKPDLGFSYLQRKMKKHKSTWLFITVIEWAHLEFSRPFLNWRWFSWKFWRANSKMKFPFKFCSLHHELLQTDLIFSFRRIWQWRSSIQFPLWFCQWLWKWPKATKPSTTSFWFASSYVVILLALSFPSD